MYVHVKKASSSSDVSSNFFPSLLQQRSCSQPEALFAGLKRVALSPKPRWTVGNQTSLSKSNHRIARGPQVCRYYLLWELE